MSSTCKICGKHGGMCVHARMSDALRAREDDQPDAMNQGVHIAVWAKGSSIVCECGDLVLINDWERHCESEGE